ncbi:Na+/H+ antiporter NhaA [Motiliproteus sp. MSK22-1]|uniref:Na+/H+ antiporter NhaA n=1 Tax=Motiliproteus sp. MSK22-1 TaxID=1897630 RepID=UPI000976A278|nr:Na+/H+ antiporter NhaA [Motiliproteus sp. MSK22-1]OMH32696.1 Na(+)/H(+) antiporter NhaA [Motiliproteus sp. MSK22-1]
MTAQKSTMSFKSLIQHESAGGVLLVLMAVTAMILANSPLAGFYEGFLATPLQIRVGELDIAKPLLLWINDGLMAVFFFLVGLEIKREVFTGHLSSPVQVVLPGIGALAGIIAPALIYFALNQHDSVAVQGWAIPSATDIAFALGIFSLFGNRIPISLKLFLLSVAIFDDIGAILIIAVFYSSELSFLSFSVAAVGLISLFVLNRCSVRSQAAYIVIGIIVWVAVLKSGVHATLAGFAVAWFIPLKLENNDGYPMLPHLEHSLHPWVAFAILPLFAFANAGVSLTGVSIDSLLNPIPLGIALGLFIGKQVGIFGACWIAIKMGLAKLPEGATWLQFYAVTVLCGIGFTMSLFIGSLAFETQGIDYLIDVKLGVLVGSLCAALAGSMLIARSQPKKKLREQLSES